MLEIARFGLAGNESNSFGQNFLLALWWNMLSFGVLLPLGLFGMARHYRKSPWLLFLFCGSFVIVNAVVYTGWPEDINKFGKIAAIVLAIFAVPVISGMWSSHRSRLPVVGLLIVLVWDGLARISHH